MMLGLIALTAAPGLAIAIYVYWRDKFERDPFFLLLTCFLLWAFSILPAIADEALLDRAFHFDGAVELWKAAVNSFIFIALIEEGVKFVCLRVFIFNRKEFNGPYNGITYAVMISMGFATIENFFYVFSGDDFGGWGTAFLRAFTAVPAHAANAVMMGYFVGIAKMNEKHRTLLSITGLVVATFFHGAYDFFLTQRALPGITGGAFIALIVAVILSRRAINIHKRYNYIQHIKAGN